MDTDGSNVRRLTRLAGTKRLPVWSPDGKRIMFSVDGDGSSRIFVMNEDGSNPRVVGRAE